MANKSKWHTKIEPILKYQSYELGLYFYYLGARAMQEKILNLPHLTSDDEELITSKITDSRILDQFQKEMGFSEEDYSYKALSKILIKLKVNIPKKPFDCGK